METPVCRNDVPPRAINSLTAYRRLDSCVLQRFRLHVSLFHRAVPPPLSIYPSFSLFSSYGYETARVCTLLRWLRDKNNLSGFVIAPRMFVLLTARSSLAREHSLTLYLPETY